MQTNPFCAFVKKMKEMETRWLIVIFESNVC